MTDIKITPFLHGEILMETNKELKEEQPVKQDAADDVATLNIFNSTHEHMSSGEVK